MKSITPQSTIPSIEHYSQSYFIKAYKPLIVMIINDIQYQLVLESRKNLAS